jgi:hypothetical protein
MIQFDALRHFFPMGTTRLDGEAIQGFYQNGTLFIVDVSDARRYFSSVNAEWCRLFADKAEGAAGGRMRSGSAGSNPTEEGGAAEK